MRDEPNTEQSKTRIRERTIPESASTINTLTTVSKRSTDPLAHSARHGSL